jgi:hypothetical protein
MKKSQIPLSGLTRGFPCRQTTLVYSRHGKDTSSMSGCKRKGRRHSFQGLRKHGRHTAVDGFRGADQRGRNPSGHSSVFAFSKAELLEDGRLAKQQPDPTAEPRAERGKCNTTSSPLPTTLPVTNTTSKQYEVPWLQVNELGSVRNNTQHNARRRPPDSPVNAISACSVELAEHKDSQRPVWCVRAAGYVLELLCACKHTARLVPLSQV